MHTHKHTCSHMLCSCGIRHCNMNAYNSSRELVTMILYEQCRLMMVVTQRRNPPKVCIYMLSVCVCGKKSAHLLCIVCEFIFHTTFIEPMPSIIQPNFVMLTALNCLPLVFFFFARYPYQPKDHFFSRKNLYCALHTTASTHMLRFLCNFYGR